MTWVLIGIGGALGSVARYQLGKIIGEKVAGTFPWATFLINVSGAFLLGFLTALHLEENIFALIGTGFLGAYTTFSTFMYEGCTLIKENDKLNAIVYIVSSLVVGIIGFAIGYGIIYFSN